MGLEDILVIAPYNAQVFDLKERIPGAKIGTVDKFQGQEAPIVIYSMTTSTHADAPRGMGFLYSLKIECRDVAGEGIEYHSVLAGAVRAGMPNIGTDDDGECVLPIPGIGAVLVKFFLDR